MPTKDNKIHFFIMRDKKMRYICNEACGVSKDKVTNDYFKITCKNCKKILDKDRAKNDENAAIESLKFKIEQEKTSLEKYVSVLVEYAFVETCTASTFFQDLFSKEMLSVHEAIIDSGLPQKDKGELVKDVFGGAFHSPHATEKEVLEEDLAYHKHLVSWAKSNLDNLPIDLKTKIINKGIIFQNAWNQQATRSSQVYKKIAVKSNLKTPKKKCKK